MHKKLRDTKTFQVEHRAKDMKHKGRQPRQTFSISNSTKCKGWGNTLKHKTTNKRVRTGDSRETNSNVLITDTPLETDLRNLV